MSQKCSLPSGRFIPRWSVVIVMIMGVEVGMGLGVTLPGLGPCDMADKGIVTLLWQAASGIWSAAGLSGASARVLVGPLLSRSCTGIANNLVRLLIDTILSVLRCILVDGSKVAPESS